MLKWFVCLFRRHQWRTWYDEERHRKRTVCDRCGAEKSNMSNTDINPSFFSPPSFG